MINDAELKTI